MKPRFVAGENVDFRMGSGLRRRCPRIAILTAVEAKLLGQEDDQVLAFAHANRRILITRDAGLQIVASKSAHACVLIFQASASRAAIDDLQLIWEATEAAEWENVTSWLPL